MRDDRIARFKAVLAKRQPDFTIITDNVHKGRNLSAIVRNADAVGISDVHCILNDADYQAFRGTAKGSQQWVNVNLSPDIETLHSQLHAEGYQFVAADVTTNSQDFRSIDYTKPTAIILGAEKWGISDAARARVDHFVTIPMVGMVESFNVSVASGILLSEMQRQRQAAGFYDAQRLSDAHYQRLFFEWSQPKVARYCQRHGFDYPPISAAGDIIDAPEWYQSVKALEVGSQ